MSDEKGDDSFFPLMHKWDGTVICSYIDKKLIIRDFIPYTIEFQRFIDTEFQNFCFERFDIGFLDIVSEVLVSGIPKVLEKKINKIEKLHVVIAKVSNEQVSFSFKNISYDNLFLLLQKIEDIILEYTKNNDEEFTKTIKEINELIVNSFDVTCSSLWMHYKDTDTIECIDIYSRNSHRHQKAQNPFPFDEKDPYFQKLLESGEYFYAFDDKSDIMQKSICRVYIKQHNLKYKYDFVLTYKERFVAMMCIETTYMKNFYTPIFKEFVSGLKQALSILMEIKFKKELEAKFKAVERNEHTGILIYRDKVLYANNAITNINGFSLEDIQQMYTWDLFAPEYREKFKNIIKRRMKGEHFPKNYSDVKIISKTGKIVYVRLSAETILYEGKYAGISTVTDITDIVEAREALHKLATTDVLTKAYNRRRMNESIDAEIDNCERYNESFGMIMFDIDYFKNINDAYGHDIGDEVLVELSELIKKKIRKSDCFARWGGEEFLLLVRKIQEDELSHLCEILRKSVEENCFSSQKLDVTISLGATMYKQGETKEDIIKRVDIALYKAKKYGRNRVVLL